jgi:hypothetical protein
MHILDIAPTVLHLHGEDVPERMDGEVRRDLFDSASEPANREISRVDVEDVSSAKSRTVERDVTDRLEDLGYME